MKFHKIATITALCLLCACIFGIYIDCFYSLGEITDLDSYRYTHYFNDLSQMKLTGFVFPLYLFLINIGERLFNFPLYVVQNSLLSALTVICSSYLTILVTRKKWAGILVFLLAGFNLQILQYINHKNPEVFLHFLIFVHVIFIYCYVKKISKINIFFLFATGTLLAFTKPIFLYYGFVVLFVVLLSVLKNREYALWSVLFFLCIYVFPIHFRSLNVFRISGIYTFSFIKEINLIGKIIEYDLVASAPEEGNFKIIKNVLQSDYKPQTVDFVYTRLQTLEQIIPDKELNKSLQSFGQKTIAVNATNYIARSLYKLPSIMNYVSEENMLLIREDARRLDKNNRLSKFNVLSESYYSVIFKHFKNNSAFIYGIIFIGILMSAKRINTINTNFFYGLIILWAYYVIVISFASYESNPQRFKAPIDTVFFMIFAISCTYFVQFLYTVIAKLLHTVLDSYIT